MLDIWDVVVGHVSRGSGGGPDEGNGQDGLGAGQEIGVSPNPELWVLEAGRRTRGTGERES